MPVADLRRDDPVDLTPPTGAQLATRLAEACADYSLKSHLGLPAVLGRDPTPDEAAIHAAAVAARDAAMDGLLSWMPESWVELAAKSEALDRACDVMRCVPPGVGLDALQVDRRRLVLRPDGGFPESRLAPDLVQALRLRDEAEETGYSDDGETWLGEPLGARAGELLDGIHLAQCTSREDAVVKLGALQVDCDETEDWSAVRATVVATIASVRCWLLEPDSKAYLRASRLMPNWMVARVTKERTVAARFS